MRKEKIFSKFNTRTFNNELEEVLANKTFSENVKNNILNMVYKIEEAYNDYELTKVEVQNEKSFLEQILISISDYCNMIEISNSNEMKEKKFIIDYEKGYIKVLANNTWLLYAILEILNNNKKKSYQKEIDMTQNKPIYDFLKLGYNINNVEVIRDFNGWSWINSVDEISNLKANLVYQNLPAIVFGFPILLLANFAPGKINEATNEIIFSGRQAALIVYGIVFLLLIILLLILFRKQIFKKKK